MTPTLRDASDLLIKAKTAFIFKSSSREEWNYILPTFSGLNGAIHISMYPKLRGGTNHVN
jgi:hypothetical protein